MQQCSLRESAEFSIPQFFDRLREINDYCGGSQSSPQPELQQHKKIHHGIHLNLTVAMTVPYPRGGANGHRSYAAMREYVSFARKFVKRNMDNQQGGALSSSGLRLFDLTEIISPFSEEVVCTDHYVCRGRNLRLMYYHVGQTAYNIFAADIIQTLLLK
jgi:hypothetical protein